MNTNLWTAGVIVSGLVAFGSVANAGEWQGQGEAGLVIASGNTESENLNAALDFAKDADFGRGEVWGHEIGFKYLKDSADEVDTADSLSADYTAKRALSQRSYAFAGLGYLDDDFDGFTEKTSAVVGYGYHVIDNEKEGLELGIGIGYSDYAELDQLGGADLSGEMLNLRANYRNQLTASTELVDALSVEVGSDNTYIENDLALIVSMSDKMALKAGILTRNNSDPAGDTKSTDTTTTLSVVYDF